MAGQAAYRYNYAPQPRYQERPAVSPVPARGPVTQLDPRYLAFARIAIVLVVLFTLVGLVRVGFASAAVSSAIEYEQVTTDIDAARAAGSALEVQVANLSNPSYVRDYATQKLGMAAPEMVETITLGQDVVALDEAGQLSLSQSLAAASRG